MEMSKHITPAKILLHVFFFLVVLTFVLPLLLVVSVSFTSEKAVLAGGFGLLPVDFTTAAYQLVFLHPSSIIQAYLVTFSQAALGTAASMIVGGMIAYPLSRSAFKYKKVVTWIVLVTMLFSGGTIPTYIIFTKYYHLGNSFLIYILPGITGGAWNILVYCTFFRGLPESLFEAAKLDGANELKIFFRIVIPLSTPVFASIGFMTFVGKWNDYYTTFLYIRSTSLYTLQYLLQRILAESEFLKSLAESGISGTADQSSTPVETLRYAMCVVAAGPMIFLFPFFQKYFSQGLVVGSVKG